MKKKKNPNKLIYFLKNYSLTINKNINFDYQTNTGFVLFLIKNLFSYSLTYPIQYTSVLKLHSLNFRAT